MLWLAGVICGIVIASRILDAVVLIRYGVVVIVARVIAFVLGTRRDMDRLLSCCVLVMLVLGVLLADVGAVVSGVTVIADLFVVVEHSLLFATVVGVDMFVGVVF